MSGAPSNPPPRGPIRETDFLSKAITFAGSLGFALGTYLLIALRLSFPHSMLDDVVGYGSMHLHSYTRVTLLYLLALTLVPALTLLAYGAWFFWSKRMESWAGNENSRLQRAASLPYLIWMLIIPHMDRAEKVFPILAGLFLIAQGLLAFWTRFLSRHLPDVRMRPGPLTHFGVLMCGTVPGLFILYSPRFQPIHEWGTWVMFFTAAAVWLLWWAISLIGARLWGTSPDRVSAADAFSYFPLLVLGLVPLLSFEVVTHGKIATTYSFPGGGKLLLGIAGIGMLLLKILLIRRWRRMDPEKLNGRFRKLLLYLAIPLWLYSLCLLPNIHGNVDLFHEGERLAPADGMLRGGFPFRDVIFIHGLVEDPGIALLGFKLFGTDLAAFRRAILLVEPFQIVVLYLFAMAFFQSLPWALGLVALYLFFGQPLNMFAITTRTLWGYLSLAFIVRFIDTQRRRFLHAGAALAAWAFLWSYDVGITVIAAGVALFLFRLLASRFSRRSLSQTFQYVAFCLGPILLYCLTLWFHGAFLEFIRTNLNLLMRTNKCFYFIPFPSILLWSGAFQDLPRFLNFASVSMCSFFTFFNPFILILTFCFLSLTLLRGKFRRIHEKILLLAVAGAVFFARSCITGREDFTQERFSQFIWILDVALVFYIFRFIRIQKPLGQIRASGAVIFAALLYLLYHHPHPLDLTVKRIYARNHFQPPQTRNLVPLPEGFRQTSVPRMGNVFVHGGQAEVLDSLYGFFSKHTKRGETIYDFSDKPALYFLLDRPFPGRFPSPMYCIPDDLQREAIRSIEESRTRYVIFKRLKSSGTARTPYEHDSAIRYFLISDYLLHHYLPYAEVGGFAILERGERGELADRWKSLLFHKERLFHLPYLWGLKKTEDILEKGRIIYQADAEAIRQYKADDGTFSFTDMPSGDLLPRRCTHILLRARVRGDGHATLSWGLGTGRDFEKEKSVEFNLHASEVPLNYLVRVGNLANWVWADSIPRITVEFEGPGNPLELERIALIECGSEMGLIPLR